MFSNAAADIPQKGIIIKKGGCDATAAPNKT